MNALRLLCLMWIAFVLALAVQKAWGGDPPVTPVTRAAGASSEPASVLAALELLDLPAPYLLSTAPQTCRRDVLGACLQALDPVDLTVLTALETPASESVATAGQGVETPAEPQPTKPVAKPVAKPKTKGLPVKPPAPKLLRYPQPVNPLQMVQAPRVPSLSGCANGQCRAPVRFASPLQRRGRSR